MKIKLQICWGHVGVSLVVCPLTQGFGEEGMCCRNDSPVSPSLEVWAKWAGEGTDSLKRGGGVKEGPAQGSCRSHSSLCMLCTSEERNILVLSFQAIILCCFNHLSDPESAEKEWIDKKLTFVLTLAVFLVGKWKICPLWIMSISGTGVKDGKLNISLIQTQISWPISVPWCVGLHGWSGQQSGCSQKGTGLSHHSFYQAGLSADKILS